MSAQTLYLVLVLCTFGAFGLAVAYGQFQTRGMVAPGARPLDKN